MIVLHVNLVKEDADCVGFEHLVDNSLIREVIPVSTCICLGSLHDSSIVVNRNGMQDVLQEPRALLLNRCRFKEVADEIVFIFLTDAPFVSSSREHVGKDTPTFCRLGLPHMLDEWANVVVAICSDNQ